MSIVFAASTHAGSVDAARSGAAEREIEVVFVDRSPDDYDPDVAEAFRAFAGEYPALAAELFDNDADLTSLVAARDIGGA